MKQEVFSFDGVSNKRQSAHRHICMAIKMAHLDLMTPQSVSDTPSVNQRYKQIWNISQFFVKYGIRL